MSRKVLIFDSTLRDGEQSPGAKLTRRQKLEIAHQLAMLGVDIIEAGFPCSSPDDLLAVKSVAEEVGNLPNAPIIAALARAVESDIDDAWEAVRPAKRPRIHVFLATSDIHLSEKLKKDRKLALEMIRFSVSYAKGYCQDVEFSTEDASRTDFAYLCEAIRVAIFAGATTINVPDTVGFAVPEQYGETFRRLRQEIPELEGITLSAHCHDDLGQAVSNSLSAIRHGADQVECTINGVGERAGNASLEEIVMNLKTREDFYRATTGINTRELYKTSRMVSRLMGIPVQPNKAIIGPNAFSHSSGVHQDGMIKSANTYQIMNPKDIGIPQGKIVLSARSGRAALKHRIETLGFKLDTEDFQRVHKRFVDLADRKKEITDDDLVTIVEIAMNHIRETFSFHSLQIMTGNTMIPIASVTVMFDGQPKTDAASGNGPVNAAYNAIDRIVGKHGILKDYDLRAVTSGKDALGEAIVKVEIEGCTYPGAGTSSDIIEASVRAYLNALNRYFANGIGATTPPAKA